MIKLTLKIFIERSNKVHGNKYDYSKFIYINSLIKSIIICPIHGNFLQLPHNHLLGKGCPKCYISKGERKIIKFLSSNKIEYVYQKTFSNCKNPKTNYPLKFDFYIPSKNILIEYDGEQHFTPGYIGGNYFTTKKDLRELKYRDNIKTKFVKENSIPLLRINYKEFKNIESILSSML